MTESSSTDAEIIVDTFHDYALHQRNLTNLLESGRKWFGEVFSSQQNHHFSFELSLIYASPATVARGWLDYIAVNVTRELHFT